MTTQTLHPALANLEPLLGTFTGDGEGHYPTIDDFRYREEVTFHHGGGPVIRYEQRTWQIDSDRPMHGEVGYLRPAGGDRVEFTLAHTFGITELQEGTLALRGPQGSSLCLELSSTALGIATTAKPVRSVRRRFDLARHELTIDLWMAYQDVPDTHHLRSVLTRIDR